MEIKNDGYYAKLNLIIFFFLEIYFENGGEALIKITLIRENSDCSLRVKTQKGSKQKV